jgi:hypothetical protein
MVSYSMVQQVSLASTEYPKGVNEFLKAGFTEAPSQIVKPPRVAESPVSMECKVLQIISTGDQGAAGNLVICEVLLMHIKEEVLDENGRIDPHKLDAVARLGSDYYARVQGESIFKVPKPLDRLGIGVDRIPERIRLSKVLTGNDLGMLGNVEILPSEEDYLLLKNDSEVSSAFAMGEVSMHELAKKYLAEHRVDEAWKVLLLSLTR